MDLFRPNAQNDLVGEDPQLARDEGMAFEVVARETRFRLFGGDRHNGDERLAAAWVAPGNNDLREGGLAGLAPANAWLRPAL